MAYNNRNQANPGFVYSVNNVYNPNYVNNVNNNVNNVQRVDTLLNSLPQPLLLQAPQVYERQRAVRRPHWQHHYNTYAQHVPQQISTQPYQQQLYPQPPIPQTQQLYPTLPSHLSHSIQQQQLTHPEPASNPPYYPQPGTPQTSNYSPQLDEINLQDQEEGEAEHEPNQSETTGKSKKKKRHGLRRRKTKEDPNQIGLPDEALGMEVKTPAQLGIYVSLVLHSLGTPDLGIYLTVNKLNYYVATKENPQKHILKDISFYIKPGMMCLVLGSPGGGRSSLFKVLANVTPKKSKVEGQVLFNNNPINPKTHHRNISYITQNDNHMPTLTVRETLWFSSECILPETVNKASKEHRLDILLNILGLTGCQDTLVGNEFIRGVSGGQKKRVTIGLDMMKGASLYFLDEPTTGLDSVTSLEVLSCVRSLALSSHVGVLCALLQPPKEVFDLFDYVLILNSGEVSYFGKTEEAVPYFENLGMKKPDHMNPAEFLQEVVVVPDDFAVDPENNELKTPDDFAREWKNSPQYEEVMEIVSSPTDFIPEGVLNVPPPAERGNIPRGNNANQTYAVPFRKQLALCMWRSYKMTIRNYISVFSRVLNLLVVALILGTLFVNLDNDQQSIAQREGLVYFAFLTILFASFVTIRDLYDQRPIFYEQRDQRKWYTTLPYFLAYITPELVIGMSCVVLFSVTLYWLVDLNDSGVRFLYFLLNLFLAELFGSSFLIAISAMTSSSLYAGVIVPSVLMLFILASGFTIPGNQIPGWWIWLYWASPVRWVYEGLLINEFSGQTFRCKAGQSFPFPGTLPGFTGQPVCALTTGEEVISSQGFNTHFWWRWIDLSVLIGFCVLCFVTAFIALKFIRLEPAAAVVVSNKQKKSKKEKEASSEKTDTVVDMARSKEGNPLAIYGCHLVFKHLSYFVHVKKKKDSDGETPQSDGLDPQRDNVDAQGNRMMGSVNASTHKIESLQAGEVRLLNDISGYAKPGYLLALMGPSGAGKSTLLDVLANRKNAGRITGEMTFDGKPRDKNFTRFAAYVTQTDVLFPTSTVREAISFSAHCRLPEQVSEEEKLAFVDCIIDDLRLAPIQNSAIGALGSGLTLEQRKRVNIAVELAANPQLLFLDEPTSGLDSAGARKVMRYVKKLSRQGRTIICTIHQPSSEIFSMFDQLLLLSQHGEMVYFGDIGENGDALLDYASQFGYRMERERNPADFALEFATATNRLRDADLAAALETPHEASNEEEQDAQDGRADAWIESADERTQDADPSEEADFGELQVSPDTPQRDRALTPITPLSTAPESPYIEASSSAQPKKEREAEREGYVETVEELVDGYYQSDNYRNAMEEMDRIQPQDFKPIEYPGTYASGFWTQLRENMKRSLVSAVQRRRAEFIFIVAQNTFLGIFLGTIFLKLGTDQDSVRNRVSLIFFSTNFAGFIGFSQIAPVAQERGVFYHEQAAGSYRPLTYGISLIVAQIPVAICAVIGYSVPAYWIPDLEPRHDWHRFLFFVFVYFLTALVFIALSVLLAVAMPNEGIAVMILGVVIPVFTLFGGFLIPRDQIPGWWIWAYWISAIHYPVEALQLNTLGGLNFDCKPNQLINLVNGDGSVIPYCPITSAHQVFSQYSLLTNWKWIDVGILAGSYFIFVILILISLAKVRWEKT